MGIPAVPAAVAVVAGVVIAIVAILVRLMGRPIAVVGSGESRVGCCAERSGGGDLAAAGWLLAHRGAPAKTRRGAGDLTL